LATAGSLDLLYVYAHALSEPAFIFFGVSSLALLNFISKTHAVALGGGWRGGGPGVADALSGIA